MLVGDGLGWQGDRAIDLGDGGLPFSTIACLGECIAGQHAVPQDTHFVACEAILSMQHRHVKG